MASNLDLSFLKNLASSTFPDSTEIPCIVTISREYGCPGIPISQKIVEALEESTNRDWRFINKQIINEAAKEFKFPSDIIEKIAKTKPRGIFEELFLAFSDIQLPNEIKVKKTIARILRSVILQGDAVILGRGGVVLGRDIKKSLHVHLFAPVSWRIGRVKELENLTSDDEARGRINTVDSERIFLRNYFAGEAIQGSIFDVEYNCKTLSEKQILDSILQLAREKGIK